MIHHYPQRRYANKVGVRHLQDDTRLHGIERGLSPCICGARLLVVRVVGEWHVVVIDKPAWSFKNDVIDVQVGGYIRSAGAVRLNPQRIIRVAAGCIADSYIRAHANPINCVAAVHRRWCSFQVVIIDLPRCIALHVIS